MRCNPLFCKMRSARAHRVSQAFAARRLLLFGYSIKR